MYYFAPTTKHNGAPTSKKKEQKMKKSRTQSVKIQCQLSSWKYHQSFISTTVRLAPPTTTPKTTTTSTATLPDDGFLMFFLENVSAATAQWVGDDELLDHDLLRITRIAVQNCDRAITVCTARWPPSRATISELMSTTATSMTTVFPLFQLRLVPTTMTSSSSRSVLDDATSMTTVT